jgi:hypothetical protein
MDRDHAGLAARVDALHPALLRLIAQTCAGAAEHGRWVGVRRPRLRPAGHAGADRPRGHRAVGEPAADR